VEHSSHEEGSRLGVTVVHGRPGGQLNFGRREIPLPDRIAEARLVVGAVSQEKLADFGELGSVRSFAESELSIPPSTRPCVLRRMRVASARQAKEIARASSGRSP